MPANGPEGSRPDRLVLVVGTGTEVGKTWVAARVLERLRTGGLAVAARKPAQSFGPEDDRARTDAAVLAAATGEPPEVVCPPHRWYPVAMAPPMAGAALGRPAFTLADLVAELQWPATWEGAGPSVGLVETAGGVRSPQAADGDAVDLAGLLRPDCVVLVADAGLGTINAVRLSLAALGSAGVPTASRPVVVLNRFAEGDDLHRRNRSWLAGIDGTDTVVTPGEEDRLAAALVG